MRDVPTAVVHYYRRTCGVSDETGTSYDEARWRYHKARTLRLAVPITRQAGHGLFFKLMQDLVGKPRHGSGFIPLIVAAITCTALLGLYVDGDDGRQHAPRQRDKRWGNGTSSRRRTGRFFSMTGLTALRTD